MRNSNKLDNDAFTQLFKDQVGTIHTALIHLESKLKEMIRLASFNGLKLALEEMADDTRKQLSRILEIAKQFDYEVTDEHCLGMKAIVKEAFNAINKLDDKPFERDMAMIFYIHVIKHVEVGAYSLLRKTAAKLKYNEAKILLTENMDEAEENSKLLALIAKEYELAT